VDVVFDPIGGDATEQAFRSLAWGGRLVVIGFAAGRIPALPANLPLLKGASMIGANYLRLMEQEPEHAARNCQKLLILYSEGKLKMPPVGREYPIEQARAAVDAVLAGQIDGRVVLKMVGIGE
jgi:NADPH2:quinone reductase